MTDQELLQNNLDLWRRELRKQVKAAKDHETYAQQISDQINTIKRQAHVLGVELK